jgi:hypothetical protein
VHDGRGLRALRGAPLAESVAHGRDGQTLSSLSRRLS